MPKIKLQPKSEVVEKPKRVERSEQKVEVKKEPKAEKLNPFNLVISVGGEEHRASGKDFFEAFSKLGQLKPAGKIILRAEIGGKKCEILLNIIIFKRMLINPLVREIINKRISILLK